MDIHSLLNTNTIFSALQVNNKKELINTLINRLDIYVDEQTLESIRSAVFERENVMSTGVGKGLAIPHGKTEKVEKNLAVFAKLKDELHFDSIDGQPVRMVFLLVGPESSNRAHIKLLSRISRLMNSASFREKILECETPEEILDAFKGEEQKYFPATT